MQQSSRYPAQRLLLHRNIAGAVLCCIDGDVMLPANRLAGLCGQATQTGDLGRLLCSVALVDAQPAYRRPAQVAPFLHMYAIFCIHRGRATAKLYPGSDMAHVAMNCSASTSQESATKARAQRQAEAAVEPALMERHHLRPQVYHLR